MAMVCLVLSAVQLENNIDTTQQQWKNINDSANAMRAVPTYSRVWNKRSPLNKHSPLENLAKRISVAPFFTLCYGVQNKAVAPG